MKKTLITLAAAAVLFSACNQAEKTSSNDHSATNHQPIKEKNVMMQAMDESMMAMHKAKQTGNPDYDFASMMIPHHEGAIVMAEAVVKNGKSPELISFANKIIEAQKKEIKMLQDFLKTASQKPSNNADKFKTTLNNSMNPMMEGMSKVKLTDNIENDFVALMIPHHQSAVDMAKAYLPYSNNTHIQLMAEDIIKAQEEEIKWLNTQLNKF
ncbi:DUF305 domain-containing protein [Pedobacter sp. LMG 31464]|uniref:DUF305 domain-containing protein n=1 Tax=Pedobacter planticolens TaxID=2679964 RepID=A0A923E0L1_9SPHI|nr:DUF305 domain-containing protein [Pedobacter planticolens]MBB2146213.1 DUF305 domain-containing protein [Pedobacter planticolens]